MKKLSALFFILFWWGLFLIPAARHPYSLRPVPTVISYPSNLPPLLRSTLLEFLQAPATETSAPAVFPQTYSAAATLLSIHPLSALAGIPAGFKMAYPLRLGDLPEIDIRHYEHLMIKPPAIALTASYTHPQMLRMLACLGIPTFSLECPKNLKELTDQVHTIAKTCQSPNDALFSDQLKSYYGELNMRATAFLESRSVKPKIYYLHFTTRFSAPDTTHLWNAQLQKWGINSGLGKTKLDHSFFKGLVADKLIIGCNHSIATRQSVLNHPLLSTFPKEKIHFVDLAQEHYLAPLNILAFFDFVHAVVHDE